MKKNLIIILSLMLTTSLGMAQKTLDEVRIINALLEPVPLDEIRDFQSYQERHFKNPRALYIKTTISEKSRARFYKLVGSNDIVKITPILSREDVGNSDQSVKMLSGTYSAGLKYSIEQVDLPNGNGAITVVQNSPDLRDIFHFQNKEVGVTFLLTYISNLPLEARLENIRRILKEMRVEKL